MMILQYLGDDYNNEDRNVIEYIKQSVEHVLKSMKSDWTPGDEIKINLIFKLEENLSYCYYPPEQAGFRKKYSTTDYIYTIKQIIEKKQMNTRNHLHLAFIDFEVWFHVY